MKSSKWSLSSNGYPWRIFTISIFVHVAQYPSFHKLYVPNNSLSLLTIRRCLGFLTCFFFVCWSSLASFAGFSRNGSCLLWPKWIQFAFSFLYSFKSSYPIKTRTEWWKCSWISFTIFSFEFSRFGYIFPVKRHVHSFLAAHSFALN